MNLTVSLAKTEVWSIFDVRYRPADDGTCINGAPDDTKADGLYRLPVPRKVEAKPVVACVRRCHDVPNTSSCSIEPVRTLPLAITCAWLYA